MYKRILVPLGGSTLAEAGLPEAKSLAHRLGAGSVFYLEAADMRASFLFHSRRTHAEPPGAGWCRAGSYQGNIHFVG
jgi:nucleotide-binding universal stress UspA family protein